MFFFYKSEIAVVMGELFHCLFAHLNTEVMVHILGIGQLEI